MPQSGVKIPQECVNVFKNMKLHRDEEEVFCLAFRIADNLQEFEITKSFKKDPSKSQADYFEEIMAELTILTDKDGKNVPSLVIWDLKCPNNVSGGQEVDRLVCMSLCPEEVPVKHRMLFASSKSGLIDELDGIQKRVDVMDKEAGKYGTFMKSLE